MTKTPAIDFLRDRVAQYPNEFVFRAYADARSGGNLTIPMYEVLREVDALLAEREALKAKVPQPVRKLREYKGVTYADGRWWFKGLSYDKAARVIAIVCGFTDADHAAIYALREQPYEPVACGCNGTDTVCVAHSGTVASAPHPRPRVGVTEAMVSGLPFVEVCAPDGMLPHAVTVLHRLGNGGRIRCDEDRDALAWLASRLQWAMDQEALALADEAAPGVVELDEWRVVDCNGVEQEVNGTAFSADEGREFAVWHDKRFPQVAPHRVMRVCLKPLANGGGEVADGR